MLFEKHLILCRDKQWYSRWHCKKEEILEYSGGKISHREIDQG